MENRTHDPLIIASYFLEKRQNGLTLMQLLKLSYIAHGFKLGFDLGPLSDEPAEAWKYGPVFPSLFHYDFDDDDSTNDEIIRNSKYTSEDINSSFHSNEKNILEIVNEVYGGFEGWQLSQLTHKKDSPWYNTYHVKGGKDHHSVPIDDDEIKVYYKEKIIKKYGLYL